MDDWPELTIGEVARKAGVATSSIRYYESIDLLPEPDRMSGQRRYRSDVLGKLGFIGVAQSAGFKLDEIKELMRGIDAGDGMADQMRSLSSRKLDEVEALLERTKAMKGWLEVAKGMWLHVARRMHPLPRAGRGVRRCRRRPHARSFR
jgi:MerR family redox-sensitive transcriptional activator SoxR